MKPIQMKKLSTQRKKSSGPREREIARLAALPWTVEIRRNHDGSYFARVVELPGCMTEGKTRERALLNLDDAIKLWVSTELDRGASIPAPPATHEYSGKFTIRTSPLVHRLASEAAERMGVSLNEFASEALAMIASTASNTGGSRATEIRPRGTPRRSLR